MAVRNPRELHDLNQYKPGMVLGGRWSIMKLLDEGCFGRVYQVSDLRKPGNFAALKIESINMDGGSAIKLEKAALSQIHKRGYKSHVPLLYRTSKRRNICYMIVTLLGENLKRIKDKYFRRGYSLRTWSRIAIQCLFSIKVVHDAGFVHRDIKACNFMLGAAIDPKRARMVHILDFGLARPGRKEAKIKEGRSAMLLHRCTMELSRYERSTTTPGRDYGDYQGRKDDIWSFLYLLIDIYAGLPWARIENDNTLAIMKQNIRDEDLLIKMPPELLPIPKHLRALEYYSRPDYLLVFKCLDKIMKRCNVSWDGKIKDHLSPSDYLQKAAILADYPAYCEPESFFEEDPVGINEGPGKKTTSSTTSIEGSDDSIQGRKKGEVSQDCSVSFREGSNNNTNKKVLHNRTSKISKQQRKKGNPSKRPAGTPGKDTSREDLSKEYTKDDSARLRHWKRKRRAPHRRIPRLPPRRRK
ncbi:hypothetical protein PMAYCL1PPCAC_11873 [Pristionchus mayeri]|uniref:non-specific serine/threonine protein kinase n=1 Tax=Pristionchus mayeri TaxID=1317129 RepID=A0AAN4ZI45_9BILA|nr:hypothetical protein PMAYCL1PPCAC_11873 [Pristionchus mayeri]